MIWRGRGGALSAWLTSRLSQEEIANQKILLAYYKQQKDRKEKRKEIKRGKKQKRK